MKIYDLFTRKLDRPINGVVKADQRDDSVVWQELNEYVVTRELLRYFRQIMDAYLASVDNPNDPVVASRMAVWVSGFFGSGKSHFLKILSYLLENTSATNPETISSARDGTRPPTNTCRRERSEAACPQRSARPEGLRGMGDPHPTHAVSPSIPFPRLQPMERRG